MEVAKFQGKEIRVGEEMCLTDMWKASRRALHHKPSKWLCQQEVAVLIDELKKKVRDKRLLRTERGRTGGTWAHWQIGLAYARYLSPKFEVWCNDILKGFINADAAVAESIIDRNDNDEDLERIERRVQSKRVYKELMSMIVESGAENWNTYKFVAAENCKAVTGKRPKELKAEAGIPNYKSARELLDSKQLGLVSGLESLECMVLKNKKPTGHKDIMSALEPVRDDFRRLVSKYAA